MKQWIGLCLGLLAWAATSAATLKIATVAPDGTAWMKELRAGADEVAARTDGRVKIKFYPGGVMGDAQTVLRKMRVGQLQGAAFTGGELAEVYPDYGLYNVPFLFESEAEAQFVRQVLDPKLAEGLQTKGMVAVGIAGGGFGYLMSGQPISGLDELKQAKMWLPEGDEISELALRLAGVSPVPLTIADVYTGLQTGLVDTVVNTPVGAIAFQWHTKLDYITDTPVAYVVGVLAMDERALRRVSPADRAVVAEVMGAALDRLEGITQTDNTQAMRVLQEKEALQLVPVSAVEDDTWRALAERTLTALEQSGNYELLPVLRAALQRYRAL